MGEVLQYVLLANATLMLAFLCAWLFEKTAIMVNLRTAYRLRLHLAVAALCAAFLPILLAPVMPLFTSLFSINGTDLIVSQYLKGNINLSATQVAEVLSAKNSALDVVFCGSSVISKLAFGIAALLRAGFIALNIIKIRNHITNSTLVHTSNHVEVRYSNNTLIPFSTRGFRKYYILIPTSLIDDPRSLKIALGHEAQHIRQRDVDWEILLSLVSPMFALNPAFWLLADRVRRFREYTCDAAYLKKGGVAARDYCLLLLEIASRASRDKAAKKSSAYAVSVPFFGQDGIFDRTAKNTLRKRIVALSKGAMFVDDGLARYVNFAPAALLVLVVATGVLISAKPAD